MLKKRIAKIYRNGKLIYVVAGHPQFAEAKKEEKVRLKQQQNENLDEGKKEEPKQTKRKFRYEIHTKRKIDFNDDKEDYMPVKSITSSQPAIPTVKEAEFKVVVPKDEPIDCDSFQSL
ncbi:hypothetical protein AgCh_005247 [Apium graveolens]